MVLNFYHSIMYGSMVLWYGSIILSCNNGSTVLWYGFYRSIISIITIIHCHFMVVHHHGRECQFQRQYHHHHHLLEIQKFPFVRMQTDKPNLTKPDQMKRREEKWGHSENPCFIGKGRDDKEGGYGFCGLTQRLWKEERSA